MNNFGSLKELDPRQVWENEESDFTPWIRDNIDKSAEKIGMEIEISDAEYPVGSFLADLIGTDLNSDKKVVIESQLSNTDHDHLGKILTYTSGLKAEIVIWIATQFRDEHKTALEWLNDISEGKIGFFGVEVHVLQIDESKPAFKFEVIAEPTEWQSEVSILGPRQQAYHKFFTTLLEEIKKADPSTTSAKSVGFGNWFSISAGKTGFSFTYSFALKKRFRLELYIDTGDKELNKQAFNRLLDQKSEIEKEIGLELSWEKLEDKRASRIAAYEDGEITDPPEKLEQLKQWALMTMPRLRRAFIPRIAEL